MNEAFSVIKQFAPELGVPSESIQGKKFWATKLQPVLLQMLVKAPDEEVIAFNKARLSMIGNGDSVNVARCAAMARGQSSSDKGTPAEDLFLMQALARLFRAAGTHPKIDDSFDTSRAQLVLAPILTKVDPEGKLDGEFAKLPEKMQCDIYLRLWEEINLLPVKDAALVGLYQAGAQ